MDTTGAGNSRRRGTRLAPPPENGDKPKRGARSGKNGAAGQKASEAEKKTGPVPATAPPPPVPHKASVFCFPSTLPDEFVRKVGELEKALNQQVWLLVQGGTLDERVYGRIDQLLLNKFAAVRDNLPAVEKKDGQHTRSRLAVLIHSGGGRGEPAYRLAKLFQRKCGGFTAIVPKMAKSAATLLSLGADSILLGEDADLGPLDAQFFDFDDAEDYVSALDEVQAVEALEQSATDTAYRVMVYLRERTMKSINVLMPHAMHFAAEITKPLFDKIDAVRYSRLSRRLREAQDYAERLLTPRFEEDEAKAIAQDLVRNYPTHEFVIDRNEARLVGRMEGRPPVGLQLGKVNAEVNKLLDWFHGNVDNIRAVGCVVPKQEGKS